MIQITLLLPLAIGGVASALWRDHRQKKKLVTLSPNFPILTLMQNEKGDTITQSEEVVIIDDAAEISHNQRVSLIALALTGSGALVFPIFTLASIPFLSYNTYYFISTIRRSHSQRKKSALTLFELTSMAGSVIAGRYLLLSSLFALSFSTRKWVLQAGNISSIGVSKAFDPNFRNIWVQRDGVEVEINLSDVKADDIAVLHAGDIIRMNGEIVEGKAMVKQFGLSGGQQVVPKQIGDSVFSYTEIAVGDLYIKYH